MRLTKRQLKIIPRIRRKYNVSIGFLKSNLANIEKFLWYALSPRIVIKRVAIRKGSKQRVILNYYHLRRVLFDKAERKVIKTRRRNVQQWSRQMVTYLRKKYGIKERIEITAVNDNNLDAANDKSEEEVPLKRGTNLAADEVSKQLKEQLELLRSGKRIVPLIENENKTTENNCNETESNAEITGQNNDTTSLLEELPSTSKSARNAKSALKNVTVVTNLCDVTPTAVLDKTGDSVVQTAIETTPEKQIIGRVSTRSEQPKHNYKADKNLHADGETVELPPLENSNKNATDARTLSSRSEIFHTNSTTKKAPSGNSFLDMLMNKVRGGGGKSILTEMPTNINVRKPPLNGRSITPERSIDKSYDNEHLTDSGEEFFGFDETERLPGMMLTPLVPFSAQSKGGANGAFVSESLNLFMRENSLENSNYVAESATGRRHRQATLDGLVTPDCVPPRIEMPLVPESLQKLRTVAERRQYLQKFNRNHKLAIINNEAAIYRELQRKVRHHKSKSVSQQVLQAPNSQMPFTRQGWKAASFVTTEFNHYYYQTLKVHNGNKEQDVVRLPGVRGNNEERNKPTYLGRVPQHFLSKQCDVEICGDALVWRDLKPLKTEPDKKRLNESPLPTVFKPCPLSHKPFQKPLDDETAPLLLAGGSMAVVRMPVVELEVFPALGKPLHEVAKRYLEYILPHGDITREWAEFSVSTLQLSTDKDGVSNASSSNEKINSVTNDSYAFPIPYLNDRSHILVRRVVDRSEKLDETFETTTTTSPLVDFSFRKDIDENDNVLVECADVLSEMINSVAISCSENSFIKLDPDGLQCESEDADTKNEKTVKDEKNKITSDDSKLGIQAAANKKQNRLLLELRRLNATIIDAAVKAEKGTKPCSKEFCVLGCVCQSLADDYPLRQHCGKAKCVIECTCKGTNQSRIMRLETDGRSITTEDAFMLRRQATARLARMEKEFTSTIVLTENETLLINESQYDKKRRCTKAPKRYEDFADTDDDYAGRSTANTPPKKTQNTAVVAIETATTTDTTLNSGFSETTTELREPIYVKDKVLEKLKHCTVPIIRFESIQNMAAWCMVHELYKCYCGGRAIEGKPLVIEKDNNTTTASSSEQSNNLVSSKTASIEKEFAVPSTKARYSFDKVEAAVDVQDEDEDDDNSVDERSKEESRTKYANVKKRKSTERKSHGGGVVKYASTDDEKSENEDSEDNAEDDDSTDSDFDGDRYLPKRPKVTASGERQEMRGRPSDMTFINKYFNTKPNGCRRTVPIPRKTYLRLNRKRRTEIHEYIAKHENKQSMLLLNEHILRSVYYHKHELEKQRKEVAQESLLRNKRKLRDEESSEVDKESKKEQSEPLQKKPLSEKEQKVVALSDEETCQSSVSSLVSTSSGKPTSSSKRLRKRSRRQKRSSPSGQTNERDAPELDSRHSVAEEESNTSNTNSASANLSNIEMNEQTIQDLVQETNLSEMQKSDNELILSDDAEPSVSSSTAAIRGTTKSTTADLTATDNECSAALSLNNIQSSSTLSRTRMDFFRDVVRRMNSHVNKKMQDIGLALKRESKVIPAPNNEILCIIKWSNFLDAFVEGFVFIWQVKLRDDQTFFAATISNVMPMVLNAVGVVNIEALPAKQLPLLGRMLLQRCRYPQTKDLAIVMQGRAKYWLVKGFLRADKSSACAKPTPKSHPLLTRKINVLSSLLAKQHIRELNKKAAQKQNEQNDQLPSTTEDKEEATSASTRNDNPAQQPLPTPPPPVQREQKTISATHAHSKDKSLTKSQKSHRGTNEHRSHSKTTNASSVVGQSPAGVVDKSKSNAATLLVQELVENNSQYTEMKTNIAFRKVTPADIEELHGLDVTTEPHRWLVLDLCKDFSHIYVPDFQELVSLDRIQKVMAFSKQKQKIVKLQFFQNAAYDAFVTPVSESKLYFGPLKLNLPPPSLILLQSVDGKMMLREVYQQMHNIQGDTVESTTAFWMVRKNGQVHFDFDITHAGTPNNISDIEASLGARLPMQTAQQTANTTESDDDDCMIVENIETPITFAPLVPQTQPNIAVKPLTELQPQTNQQKSLAVSRTNFTIQTSSKSNRLQITNLGTAAATNNTTPTAELPTTATQFQMLPTAGDTDLLAGTQMSLIPLSLPMNTQLVPFTPNTQTQTQILPLSDKESNSLLCAIPTNAVITGVEAAPQEASYGTTIFISSLSTTDANGTQISQDNQVANVTPATTSVPTSNVASTGDATTVGSTPTIHFITPDVRVTATSEADLLTTTALTTSNKTINCTLSTIQQQSGAFNNTSASTNQALTAPSTVETIPIVPPDQQQTLNDETKDAANKIPENWKRFLMDENSKSSTIGSTTITKMVEKLEYAVNNGLSVSDLQIEEDEFEPAATIVFKNNPVVSTPNEIHVPNATQTAAAEPKIVNVSYGSNHYYSTINDIISVTPIEGTATTATAQTTNANTAGTKTPTTPMLLSQPFSLAPQPTTAMTKAPNKPTKAQVTTIPSRKIAPANEFNKLRQISTVKAVAKSTSLPYNAAMTIATSTTSAANPTRFTTLTKASNQTLAQQLKAPSQPLRPFTMKSYTGSRLSLPATMASSTSTTATSGTSTKPTTNLTIASVAGGVSAAVAPPKPLINVRPGVPLPQRINVANTVTKRYSDSALLATTLANSRASTGSGGGGGGGGAAAAAASGTTSNASVMQKNSTTITTSFASRSNSAATTTSRPSSTNNNASLKTGITKSVKHADEQYGVFCSSTSDSSPRFWAKRVKNSYIVKVPGLSTVVHRADLESVGTYLNQHLMCQSPAMKSKLPIKWKFVPSDQLNLPIKMLKTNQDGSTSEKVLIRRYKAPGSTASATAATATNSTVCNFLREEACPKTDQNCSETILIED